VKASLSCSARAGVAGGCVPPTAASCSQFGTGTDPAVGPAQHRIDRRQVGLTGNPKKRARRRSGGRAVVKRAPAVTIASGVAMDTTRVSFLLRLRDREDKVTWQDFTTAMGSFCTATPGARGASDADAEDVVQEVEMYLFKALDGFQYDACKGRFRAYLRASVVHAMGRRASRERRQPTALDPHDSTGLRHEEEPAGMIGGSANGSSIACAGGCARSRATSRPPR
jgi:hypothetical protein